MYFNPQWKKGNTYTNIKTYLPSLICTLLNIKIFNKINNWKLRIIILRIINFTNNTFFLKQLKITIISKTFNVKNIIETMTLTITKM